MAVNLTRTVAAVISDNSRVDKAPMRDLLNEVILAINNLDPLLTPSYPNRDAAEVAASSLPSAVNRIIVQEGGATVTRSRTAFADDPLYATGARWGVVQRQNMAAVRDALTTSAPIPLASIGGSANEITATVAASHLSLGVSVVGDGSEAILVPVQTNTNASPTLAIGPDIARSVRRIDGSDLPAGALIVGQPYIIRRTAGQYRVVRGDVTSVEVATIRNDLAPVQSTIIASSSPSQRDIRGMLRPNTFINITDAIITGSPFSALNPVSGSLSVVPIAGGVKHEWREPNGRIWTNYHLNGAWTGWVLQLNKATVDGSISAQSSRIGEVEQFKSVLEAISVTDTIVAGQTADMSALSNTSSSGAAVMVLTGTAFLSGGMLRRVRFFSTAGGPRVAAITTWSADGSGRRLYASQDVTMQPGYNDIEVSLPIPAGGTVGITGMAASIGINSSLPGVPIVFSDDVAAEYLDGSSAAPGFRFMFSFDVERKQLSLPSSGGGGGGGGSAQALTISDGKGLSAWRAKIGRIRALLGGVAKIAVTGDSWAEWRHILATPLTQMLWAEHGQSGTGWLGLYADESGLQSQLVGDARLVRTGTWIRRDMHSEAASPDGYAFITGDATATISLTGIRADRIRWFYKSQTAVFTYSVDGGAPVTVNAGNVGSLRTLDITGLTPGTHTLTIQHVSGNAVHYGGYATMAAAGVEYSKCGNGGSTAAEWQTVAAQGSGIMSMIAPDVVVIVLGTNDTRLSRSADTFEAGLRAMIAAWRVNNPSCGFIIVLPPENSQAVGSPLFREYYDRIVTIAGDTAAVEYVSLFDRWPSYSVSNSQLLWADGLHLNPGGGFAAAGAIHKLL